MSPLPERIGPYRIIRALDQGGYGQVFQGINDHDGTHVAIKVLAPKHLKARDVVARFIREGKALEKLEHHPDVVNVIQCGVSDDGSPYLAMEFLKGKNLRQWHVEHGQPMRMDLALSLGHTIASAMVDIHAQGFIHRDLKPENIMLVDDAESPCGFRTKILDFGIAKVPAADATHGDDAAHFRTAPHDPLGTHAYMPPEQCIDGDNITNKADVYAFGVVMHELLSGQTPFQTKTTVKLVLMHGRELPPNLHDLVPSIPPDLATFITSMLAKAPNDRPSMRDCRDMFARDWSHDTADCPFPGLQPFNDAQAHLFFGRREETPFLLGKLDEIFTGTDRPWLQIQGPSGIGKSSLVRAALLPNTIRSKHWYVVSMRPGQDPLHNLVAAFATTFHQDEHKLIAAFRKNPDALDGLLESSDRPILLVIDAFEEWFALGATHIPHFTKWLKKTLARPHSPLRLLTTIRSDYLHRFDQTLELAQLLDRHAFRYDLRPMTEQALAEVVEGMAGRAGLRLSKGLPEKMVQDAAGTDCHLPLLGHTLRTLWSRRGGGEITHEHYGAMGGVGGALANRVKELLNGFLDTERERAKWLILDLVQIGQGGPDTRRPRLRKDVLRAAGNDEQAETLLDRLSGLNTPACEEPFRWVVVSEKSEAAKEQHVELVHDMVLHKVPIVAQWINEHRALLELLGALESLAQAWFVAGKPKRDLPAGTLLDHYRGGKENRVYVQRMASANARAFLKEAIRQQEQQRWLKRGIGAIMALAVLAIVVNAVRAEREKERAEFAQAMAEHEKVRAEIEKTRAIAEAQHARNSLRLVLDMVDEIVNRVDWRLGRIGHTLETRKKLMGPVYERLVNLPPEDQEIARVALIDTQQRVSDLERLHGEMKEANRVIDEAEARIDSVLKKDPNNKEFIALRAMNYSKRGKLRLIAGDSKLALEDFENSILAFQEASKNPEYRDDQALATSFIEKGDALVALGQLELARKSYSDGLSIRQELAKNNNDYSKTMVAEAHMLRSQTTTDSALAQNDLNAALEIMKPVAGHEKHNLLYQSILCRIMLLQAKIHDTERDIAGSRNAYLEAKRIAESLRENAPEQKEYGLMMLEALQGLDSIGAPIKNGADLRCTILTSFASRDAADRRFNTQGCP